jgi:hypothetical protein
VRGSCRADRGAPHGGACSFLCVFLEARPKTPVDFLQRDFVMRFAFSISNICSLVKVIVRWRVSVPWFRDVLYLFVHLDLTRACL